MMAENLPLGAGEEEFEDFEKWDRRDAIPRTAQELRSGLERTWQGMHAAIAGWLPVPYGLQQSLIEFRPEIFFKPPYVSSRGWVGIELENVSDEQLSFQIQMAWELIAPKRLVAQIGSIHDE